MNYSLFDTMNYKQGISIVIILVLAVSIVLAHGQKEEYRQASLSCKADSHYQFDHEQHWLFHVKKEGQCCSFDVKENMIVKECQ